MKSAGGPVANNPKRGGVTRNPQAARKLPVAKGRGVGQNPVKKPTRGVVR